MSLRIREKQKKKKGEKKNDDVNEKRSSNRQLLSPFRLVAIVASSSFVSTIPMSYFLLLTISLIIIVTDLI
jgi:hypothetical protein